MRRLHSCSTVASRIAHPPLEITLNHEALAFYVWALRLPADDFPIQQDAHSPPHLSPLHKYMAWNGVTPI